MMDGIGIDHNGSALDSPPKGISVRRSVADLVVLADDLSGAAESAAALATAAKGDGFGVHLLHLGDVAAAIGPSRPVVIDTNTRSAPAADVPALLAPAAGLVSESTVVVKKVDSLLRGHVASEVEWLRRFDRPIVVAPALPAAGRIVRVGSVLVHGAALADAPAWAIEASPAPTSLPKSFSSTARSIGLSVVRGAAEALGRALRDSGGIAVCDAESADDLRRIARAALSCDGPAPILVGASALVTAVAELLDTAPDPADPRPPVPSATRVAFVVGTAEPSAQRQVTELEAAGAAVLRLDPARLMADVASASAEIAAVLAAPLCVITFDLSSPFDPGHGAGPALALADAYARAASPAHETALVLTGGHTARTVLDACGVRRLMVIDEVDAGAARALTDTGLLVVTRPGSFGDDGSLLRIAAALATPPTHERPAQ
jgi:4-hydroxythreonine-4-phosphate dehydrogenase